MGMGRPFMVRLDHLVSVLTDLPDPIKWDAAFLYTIVHK